jgi:hypothetical protein
VLVVVGVVVPVVVTVVDLSPPPPPPQPCSANIAARPKAEANMTDRIIASNQLRLKLEKSGV